MKSLKVLILKQTKNDSCLKLQVLEMGIYKYFISVKYKLHTK